MSVQPKPPLEGAADAPIIVFDAVPVIGMMPGFGRLVLEASVDDLSPEGAVTHRPVVVAHLRGNALAFRALREAITKMEAMRAGPAPGTKAN